MKTIKIYLMTLLMVASTTFAQKSGSIDDVYFKPSDARNMDIKANERQRPAVKNGARQIVFVDANNTDVIVTNDTVFVLEKANQQAQAAPNDNQEEGEYINGFNGSSSDLEYAERIRRFHNPKYSIHISDARWNDIYFLNNSDWNVYVDDSYAWITPTWTNNFWFDYNYRPFSYSSMYWRNSWNSPFYAGWGGYGGFGWGGWGYGYGGWGGYGGWNSWHNGYYNGYYDGYYGYGYGYGNYWNNPYYWNSVGGNNTVTNNSRGRATDYNVSGTRQSSTNSGGSSAGLRSGVNSSRSSYSAVGNAAQSSRTYSTGTRSISTGTRSQSVPEGVTRSSSTDRTLNGRSYSTQGTRSSSTNYNNSATRGGGNTDSRSSAGTYNNSSRSSSSSAPSSRSYSTSPSSSSSRSYSTSPTRSTTRSSSAPTSTRSYSPSNSSSNSSSSRSSSTYSSSPSRSSSSSSSSSRSSSSSSSGSSSRSSSSSSGSRR